MWRPNWNTYHDDRDWDDLAVGVGVRNDCEEEGVVPHEEVATATTGAGPQLALVPAPVVMPAVPAPPAVYLPSAFTPRTPGQVIRGTWEDIMSGRSALVPLPRERPPVTVAVLVPEPRAILAEAQQAYASMNRVLESALEIHDHAVITVEAPLVAPTLVDPPDVVVPIGTHTFEDLRGPAGTGKTHQTKELARRLPKGSIILAATTGIAAVNLGGGEFETTTINAIGKYFDTEDLREKHLHGRLRAVVNRYRRAGVTRIVIDEKSMLAPEQLTYWTRAVLEANDPTQSALEEMSGEDVSVYKGLAPMGITLVGDFAQLAPVPDVDPHDPKKKKKLPVHYAFDSPEWQRYAAHSHTLTHIWRQNDRPFIEALHAVRRGDPVRAMAFFTPDKFSRTSDDVFGGTTVFATNAEVERYNQIRLDSLQVPEVTSTRLTWGELRSDWANVPKAFKGKVGATVMLLSNEREPGYKDRNGHWKDGDIIYANGDLGTIVDVRPPVVVPADYAETAGVPGDTLVDYRQSPEYRDAATAWLVRLQRNGAVVSVSRVRRKNYIPLEPGRLTALQALYPDTWAQYLSDDHKKEMIGWIDYLPLRVAYGCTVHKTQGLSMDNVQINLGDYFFKKPAMLYVALSRARTPEGLRIVGDAASFAQRCTVDGRVLPWL